MLDEYIEITNKYTTIEFESSNIFVPQNARCELWKICLFKKESFDSVCKRFDYQWYLLIQRGFNANFLTRDRWLDIHILVKKLGVTLDIIRRDLRVCELQIQSWNLTAKEFVKLSQNVTPTTRFT